MLPCLGMSTQYQYPYQLGLFPGQVPPVLVFKSALRGTGRWDLEKSGCAGQTRLLDRRGSVGHEC